MNKAKLLLHVCCAPCGAGVAELLNRNFNVTGFFYNPNIQPGEEYQKRRLEVERYFQDENLPLIAGDYDIDQWFEAIKGLENEPEGGRRCEACYQFRLVKTAQLAKNNGFEWFATTLTISPHKKAETVNRIGQELGWEHGLKFYEADFKKNDGFKKSCDLARELGFYRQNYCGCLFSRR